MPVVRIYGQLVTVRDGDLPYLAARAAAHLTGVTAPDGDADPDPDRAALRGLLDDLRALLDDDDYVPGTRLAHVRARVARARDALDAPVAPVRLGDVEPDATRRTGPAALVPPDLDVRTVGEPPAGRPVQLRASVGWDRDGGVVTLGLGGYRHDHRAPDEPPEVDLGGLALELDWPGCNRLIAAVRTARVGAWGVAE